MISHVSISAVSSGLVNWHQTHYAAILALSHSCVLNSTCASQAGSRIDGIFKTAAETRMERCPIRTEVKQLLRQRD